MFPAEIIERIICHCDQNILVTSRRVCRTWFHIADACLDKYRTGYFLTITHKNRHRKIDHISSVLALNRIEATQAFLLWVHDPIWAKCVETWAHVFNLGNIPENHVECFSLHPVGFAKILHGIYDQERGLCISNRQAHEKCDLPRGSWRQRGLLRD